MNICLGRAGGKYENRNLSATLDAFQTPDLQNSGGEMDRMMG